MIATVILMAIGMELRNSSPHIAVLVVLVKNAFL